MRTKTLIALWALWLAVLPAAANDLVLTRVPPAYAWASRPTCATPGDRIYVTDLGIGGSLWLCDGTEWHPAAVIVLGRSAAAVTDTTGTTEFNLASVAVPAGAMGANGALEVEALWTFTGSVNSKTLITRISTSAGAVTGTALINSTTTTATNVAFKAHTLLRNRNSASSQYVTTAALTIAAGFGTNAGATGSANTANATFVNFNAVKATGAETMTLEYYDVRLVP